MFVAHSMGGLIVKKAYLRSLHDPRYQDLNAQIKAVIFLSTPHRGSDMAKTLDSILSLWLSPFSQKSFIKDLMRGSATLADINEDFRHHVSSKLEVHSFYETKRTAIGSFKKVQCL